MDEQAEYAVLSKAAYDFFHGGEALAQLELQEYGLGDHSIDEAHLRRTRCSDHTSRWFCGRQLPWNGSHERFGARFSDRSWIPPQPLVAIYGSRRVPMGRRSLC